ncbi:(S)-8-oxocitronellyl enol synthase CYC2-like [Telopea speciosissima]|uniref:(S)-8-oxocitronellyl enol synthase CYC2-like n=1 Tax=Telopea speciosissima TaxID=54955 RepID=UPI001CC5FA6F|nr:(S)-8-oxocitronellyl enol synthase CYC2-like [Telopea speciosissima]
MGAHSRTYRVLSPSPPLKNRDNEEEQGKGFIYRRHAKRSLHSHKTKTFLAALILMAIQDKKTAEALALNVALIFGVTGIVGKELARTLATRVGWKVYGIARKADELQIPSSNYQFISCDLLDPIQTTEKVSLLEDVTHVYWITWASQYPLDSPECCEQNKAMMSNTLNAILPKAKALKHVSLQTGGKHYLSLTSPFNSKPILYYEDSPRVDQGHNFYYILEDLLMEKLEGKVAWSVHRPGLLIGISDRTYYNFIGGLCVYASICKYLNIPFLFGGSKECWEEVYIDGADARLVAEQHIWASTNENVSSTKGQAFNVTNGPSFTWKEIWPAIGNKFGVKLIKEEMFSPDLRFLEFMADKGSIWEEIVKKEGLRQTKMEDLANWPFMDILFRCSHKMLLSSDKANKLGFTMTYQTLESILYWIDCMREERFIPAQSQS